MSITHPLHIHILAAQPRSPQSRNVTFTQMAVGYFWASIGLCAFIFVLALDIMGIFSRKNHFDVDGRVSRARDI
jgi:hypothetical protein